MKKKAKSGNAAKGAFLGASLAGLAAGAYFFFGPKGKANRRHAKSWAIKMKGDVVEKLESVKEVTEPVYRDIVDEVATRYTTGVTAGKAEVEAVAADLKKRWKNISKTARTAKKNK